MPCRRKGVGRTRLLVRHILSRERAGDPAFKKNDWFKVSVVEENMKWKQGMFLCMALIASFGGLTSGESSQDHAAAVLFKNFETVVHSTPALISKTRPESVTSMSAYHSITCWQDWRL
jgi:hypothetical protein